MGNFLKKIHLVKFINVYYVLLYQLNGSRLISRLIKRTMTTNGFQQGREDILDSKAYCMAAAILASKRSPDPRTQVGACVVNNSRIVGIGYNKFPDGCENKFPWTRNSDNLANSKHGYVVHAEANAILNTPSDQLRDSELFVTRIPCNECAKLIVQCGIKQIFFLNDDFGKVSQVGKIILKEAGLLCQKYSGSTESIEINF